VPSTPRGDVAGLILAAGAGHRLGEAKALVRLGAQTLLERCADTLRKGGCSIVVAVVGSQAPAIAQHARAVADVTVVNERWHEGMSTSLRAGLDAVAPTDAGAVVIVLVDQPLISPQAVRRVIQAWGTGAAAAVATYAGERRHPVLLDLSVIGDVAASATADEGARAWLRRAGAAVTGVPCEDVASPDDIDTVEDLDRIRRMVPRL
jgi:CTP:molybdopterin cytidylyltransferase MocA